MITIQNDCRVCKGELEFLFTLGEQPIVNFGDKSEVKAPLEMMKCKNCHLVQLHHTVNPDFLYRKYYYRSGTNPAMREALRDVVESAKGMVKLEPNDVIVDIGSNDGTLLDNYPNGILHLGFEPSQIQETGSWRNSGVTNDFFSYQAYVRAIAKPGYERWRGFKAKIVTAIAMFYFLSDPNTFLQDIKKILAPEGLFVIQMNYLPTMLATNGFDNLEHEHVTYWSVIGLDWILQKNDLCIQNIEFNDVNGGSFRSYIRHIPQRNPRYPNTPVFYWASENVKMAFDKETELGLDSLRPYQEFSDRIREIGFRLKAKLLAIKIEGKKIYALGAGTRGLIILQFADIDRELIDLAVERNAEKVGKTYGSTGIPIISEEEAKSKPPDYYFITAPHYLSHFVKQEREFLQNGGKFIVPLPWPTILGAERA